MLSSLSIVRRLVRRSPNDPPPQAPFYPKSGWLFVTQKAPLAATLSVTNETKKKKEFLLLLPFSSKTVFVFRCGVGVLKYLDGLFYPLTHDFFFF
jgi:hypothetical protein